MLNSIHARYLRNTLGAIAIVCLAMTHVSAQITPFSDDFESYDQTAAIIDNGWLVGANVFDTDGTTFLYNYFSFPAPNGTGAFTNITRADTDPPGIVLEGSQSLVVFSDYQNQDHGLGRFIEANVFREATVTGAEVGQTATFSFEATDGDLVAPTTALAFIKTLDPNDGFALIDFVTADMTTLPTTNTPFSLSLDITVDKVGLLFQYGFLNVATNFDGSGVNYDLVDLSLTPTGSGALEGDYDGSGTVSQGDLDVVLLNWGGVTFSGDENALPDGGPFDGVIGQNELDGVLLNWGNSIPSAAVSAIPEPTSLVLIALASFMGLKRRRSSSEV